MAIDTPARPGPPETEVTRRPEPGIVAAGKAAGQRAIGAGDAFLGVFDEFYNQLKFYWRTLRALPRALRYPKEILILMSDISLGSGALIVGGGMFFVVVSIAFFTGTEVGLEGFNGLQQIGAEAFTGVITALANTREITPLVAGVALAAQVGAGFTAQLGAMRISDEIDALEVMGVNSVVYLVATRVWAALVTMIPLYLAALFASYLASELVVTKFFGLSTGTYTHYFRLYLPPLDIFYSFLKAMVFAVLVTFVHCYYGYNASGGPAGVGVAAGRAIRLSIILVVVVNLFMSLILFGGVNATARLVG
jgi:phospholipid/cholesterol/gamma-HCH transport system permease protein